MNEDEVMREKNTFIMCKDWGLFIQALTTQQKADLLDAIFAYQNGEEVDLGDTGMSGIFAYMKATFDKNDAEYDKVCTKNAENGAKGGRPKKPTETQENPNKPTAFSESPKNLDSDSDIDIDLKDLKDKEKVQEKEKPSKRFVPPTVDEVREYCMQRNNSVDPQTFVDFYESKGWMVGKNHMKDWKAAIRSTWERDKAKQKREPPKNNYAVKGREYDWKSLETMILNR